MIRRVLGSMGYVPKQQVQSMEARLQAMETKIGRLRDRQLASGVPMSWDSFTYEQNAAFTGTNKWNTLDEMESDPRVKGSLRMQTLPLINADWTVEPASDEEKDAEIAEFVSANLFRQGGEKYDQDYWCQTSWKAQRLPEILDMLRAGFSMFALSSRVVNGKEVFDRIQWLEPSSVDPHGWELDEQDNIVRVRRTYMTPTDNYRWREELPIDAIALFPFDLRGARFEGRPFVRSMYGSWFRKSFILKNATVWAQKFGSPVPFVIIPSDYTEEEQEYADTFAQTLRGTAPTDGYGRFRMTADGQAPSVNYAGIDRTTASPFDGMVDTENAEIAAGGGTKSMLLGETASGSRALGETTGGLEMEFVRANAIYISELMMHGAANMIGLVEWLVKRNFPAVKKYPRITVGKIDPLEGLEALDQIIAAKQAGLIPNHPDLRRQITERFGIALPDDAYEIEEPPPGLNPFGQDGEAEDEEDGEEQEAQEAEDSEGQDGERMAALKSIEPLLQPADVGPVAGKDFRRPTVLEAKYCQLSSISLAFRQGESKALGDFRSIRSQMVADLVRRVRTGKISARNLESQGRSKFRGQTRAVAQLNRTFESIARQGAQHVAEELKRMED